MINRIKEFFSDNLILSFVGCFFCLNLFAAYFEIYLWFILLILIVVGFLIARFFYRERKFDEYLSATIDRIGEGYFQVIKKSVDDISVSDIDGYFFIPKWKAPASERPHKIYLRPTQSNYWWETRVLTFDFDPSMKKIDQFQPYMTEGSVPDENSPHFVVRVPRVQSNKGKFSNRYDWEWILKKSSALSDYFENNFPENPEKAFRRLVYEESCFQMRSGTKPSWVQNAEYQKCPKCKKSMAMIAQLQSDHFGFRDFTIYIFGCPNHEGEIKTVWQCT